MPSMYGVADQRVGRSSINHLGLRRGYWPWRNLITVVSRLPLNPNVVTRREKNESLANVIKTDDRLRSNVQRHQAELFAFVIMRPVKFINSWEIPECITTNDSWTANDWWLITVNANFYLDQEWNNKFTPSDSLHHFCYEYLFHWHAEMLAKNCDLPQPMLYGNIATGWQKLPKNWLQTNEYAAFFLVNIRFSVRW